MIHTGVAGVGNRLAVTKTPNPVGDAARGSIGEDNLYGAKPLVGEPEKPADGGRVTTDWAARVKVMEPLGYMRK